MEKIKNRFKVYGLRYGNPLNLPSLPFLGKKRTFFCEYLAQVEASSVNFDEKNGMFHYTVYVKLSTHVFGVLRLDHEYGRHDSGDLGVNNRAVGWFFQKTGILEKKIWEVRSQFGNLNCLPSLRRE